MKKFDLEKLRSKFESDAKGGQNQPLGPYVIISNQNTRDRVSVGTVLDIDQKQGKNKKDKDWIQTVVIIKTQHPVKGTHTVRTFDAEVTEGLKVGDSIMTFESKPTVARSEFDKFYKLMYIGPVDEAYLKSINFYDVKKDEKKDEKPF